MTRGVGPEILKLTYTFSSSGSGSGASRQLSSLCRILPGVPRLSTLNYGSRAKRAPYGEGTIRVPEP